MGYRAAAAGSPSPWRMLRRDDDFRRYWVSRVVSLAGDWVTYVVLPVLVYRRSGSAFLTAVTSGLAAGAYLVFGLLAGALGDRLDRRRVMVTCDACSAVVVGSVPLVALLGRVWVVHLLLVAFAVQVLYTFFDGANFGALPVLVGQDRIAVANAGVWTAQSVVDVLAPPVTGAALAVAAPTTLLALDAVSFAASALLVSRIRRPMHDLARASTAVGLRRLWQEILEGLRYLWDHPGLRAVTVIGVLQSASVGGMLAMLVPWSDRVLGIGTSGWRFSSLYIAWGVGAVVASALMPFLLRRLTTLRLTMLATPVSAALAVLVALSTAWWAAAAAVMAWSVASTSVSVGLVSYRQEAAPERLLGRVNTAGRMLSWGIGGTGGALVVGALAGVAGVRPTVVAVAVFGLAAATLAWTSPMRRGTGPGPVAPAAAG
jgi:MFS family permease